MSVRRITGSTRPVCAGLFAAAVLCLASPDPVRARETAPADQAAAAVTDQELRELVRDLEARIAELERELKAIHDRKGTGAASDVEELQRRLNLLAAELEKVRLGAAATEKPLTPAHGLGPAASRVYGVAKGVSLGGYGDVLYENFSARDENGDPAGGPNRFDFLRGVLYAGYKFNDRIVFNSEIEFEHASTESGGAVAVEFAYLDFLQNPHGNIRAGLLLVPAGFINEQHEPPTYLGARRPSVETRIEPATWADNGAGVFGEAGPITYRAFVLTGLDSSGFTAEEAIREGRQGGSEALAEDFALAVRVDYAGLPGLLIGGFGYRGNSAQGAEAPIGFSVDPNGAPITPRTTPFDAPVTLYDAHAQYRSGGLQLRALYADGRVGDARRVNDANGFDGTDSIGSRFSGWYAEAGWDLLSRRRQGTASVVPFVRYEAFNTQRSVPDESPRDPDPSPLVQPAPFAADPANDVRAWTFGAVYKPILNVSVKLDYQMISNEAGTGVDQISFALGYLF